MSTESPAPDGSMYVVIDGQIKLVGVCDDRSYIRLERGIRDGPPFRGYVTREYDGRVHVQAELAAVTGDDVERDNARGDQTMNTDAVNPNPGEVLASPARRVTIKRSSSPGDNGLLITQDDGPAVVLRTSEELRATGHALLDVAQRVEAERRPAYRVPHDVSIGDRVYLAHPDHDGDPVGVLDGVDEAGRVSRVWIERGPPGDRVTAVEVKGGMFGRAGERYDRLDDADNPVFAGHFVQRLSSGKSGSVIIVTQ